MNQTQLMPHQQEAVKRATLIRGPVFVNSDTGTGKSKIAIAAAQALKAERGLIVCPGAVLAAKWVDELAEMGIQGKVLSKPKDFDHDVRWNVASYQSILFSLKDLLYGMRSHLGAVVFDESHYLKNRMAKRTRAWREYVAPNMMKGKVLLLSATPIMKSPLDIVSQYEAVWLEQEKQCLYNNTSWEQRWIGGKQISECVGWRNPSQTKHMLEARRIRHTKQEVFGDDLPPMRHKILPVAISERSLRSKVEKLVCGGKGGMDAALREAAIDEYFSGEVSEPSGIAMRVIHAVLEAAGELKAKAAAEYVLGMAETEPVVVFAHHRSVLSAIADEFPSGAPNYVVCTGAVDKNRLALNYRKFLAGGAEIMLASYGVMGTGVDLIRSRHMVIAQPSFSPAVMQQAYNRIHRIGQSGITECDTLMGEGDGDLLRIEQTIARNHRRKREAAAGAGLSGSLDTASVID